MRGCTLKAFADAACVRRQTWQLASASIADIPGSIQGSQRSRVRCRVGRWRPWRGRTGVHRLREGPATARPAPEAGAHARRAPHRGGPCAGPPAPARRGRRQPRRPPLEVRRRATATSQAAAAVSARWSALRKRHSPTRQARRRPERRRIQPAGTYPRRSGLVSTVPKRRPASAPASARACAIPTLVKRDHFAAHTPISRGAKGRRRRWSGPLGLVGHRIGGSVQEPGAPRLVGRVGEQDGGDGQGGQRPPESGGYGAAEQVR